MRLFITTFLFSLVNFQVFSQTVTGIVEDEYDNALFGVTVINKTNKTGVSTNVNGHFKITAKKGDVLKFTYVGKKAKLYTIKLSDTTLVIIRLKDDFAQLKEFVVDGKRIKKVSAKDNDNILDYYSLGENTFLILKSSHKKYHLTIEGIDTVYKTYPLKKIKPKSLFKDVFGNFHLICKDSVRQFYFDSTLYFRETISIKKIYKYINSLIYQNDSVLISYEFSQHNKIYSLYNNSYNNSKTLLKRQDELARKIASQCYNEIIALYHSCIPEGLDLIYNGVWDGNLISLQCTDVNIDLTGFIWWYEKIRGREIKVQTFSVSNTLLTFDFLNDSLIVQNINGNIIHKTKLVITNKGFTKQVVLDKEQNTFYAYSLNNGVVTLDEINLLTGSITDSYEIKGVTFPKNVKIIEGWVYFINPNKNGYHKLYRTALGR